MKEIDSKSNEPCCVFPQTWLKSKEWGYEDLDREGDNYWGKYGSNNREVNIHMKRHICWSRASTSPLIFKNLWGTERTFLAATAHAFTLDVNNCFKNEEKRERMCGGCRSPRPQTQVAPSRRPVLPSRPCALRPWPGENPTPLPRTIRITRRKNKILFNKLRASKLLI